MAHASSMFFRYFADKREVLFHGSEELLVRAVAGAREPAAPLDVVATALGDAAATFEQRRSFSVRRQQVIAASTELQERERIKLASLATAVAQALRLRGVGDPAAILAAEAGIAMFRVAIERWVAQANGQTLHELIDDSVRELRDAITGAAPAAR